MIVVLEYCQIALLPNTVSIHMLQGSYVICDSTPFLFNKENKSQNLLRRNLSKCSINVKENSYLTIVRPLLEYVACVWDPYQEYLIYNTLKKFNYEQLDGFFLITTILAV